MALATVDNYARMGGVDMRIQISLGPLVLFDLTLFRTEVPAVPNGPQFILMHHKEDDDDDDDDRREGPGDMFGGKG